MHFRTLHWVFCLTLAIVSSGWGYAQNNQAQSKKAQAYFANAADFQNAGAFELAAEEWEKLVKEFPNEPQTSTAWHHLGICNLQRKEPNYPRAIEALRESLKDDALELREETLINLGWALFSNARRLTAGSVEQKQQLEESKSRLVEFLKQYPDGAYIDQAFFYLGDIEHLLGERKRAIGHFKRFLENDKLAKSSLRPDALYALGVAFQDEGESAEANRRYGEFLKQYPSHKLADEVRIRAAELQLTSDKYSDAESLLKQVKLAPDSPLADLALLRLGYVYGKLGQNDTAIAKYEQLLTQFPKSTHARSAALAAGQLAIQLKNYDAALKFLKPAMAGTDNTAAEAIHWTAVALMGQNKNAEAAEQLTSAMQQYPDHTALRLDLADALYAQPQRRSEARQIYEAITSDKPDSAEAPRAAYNAAFMALEAGEPVQAQAWAEKFLNKYPTDSLRADVAYVAAESLLRQGHYEAAAQAYAKLIESNAKNDSLLSWKLRQGRALYLSGKYEAAVTAMQSLAAESKDGQQKAEAKFLQGASLMYQDQPAAAITQLEESRRLNQQWSGADETLLVLGEAYQREKNYAAAKKQFQQLLTEFPKSAFAAQVQYKLAQLLAAEGSLDQAIQQYQVILDNASAANYHNFAQYGIAWCQMQQDKPQAAHDTLQTLIAKNLPDSIGAEALLADGVCLRKLGQTDQSAAKLEAFLSRKPQGVSLANGLYELGLVQTEQKQLDRANATLQRIVTEVPDYANIDRVLYEIAWNLVDQDQGDAAIAKFKEIVSRFPNSEHAAESNYMIGQQSYDAKDYAEAIATYQRILSQTKDASLLEKAIYKLGWSFFQQQQYDKAAVQFDSQTTQFPQGPLAVDGLFMFAECAFKKESYEAALTRFQKARAALEANAQDSAASAQVRTLIYLHGGQSLRELKRWNDCEQWLNVVIQKHSDSPYLPTALYELGFCKQNMGKTSDAITHYSEVASTYRNEVAARARFMLGELYFSQKDFVKAIPEFQRVMYGFGGDKAPDDIKNWQAKSAFEAARCSEVLINNLSGASRKKVVDTAIEFYEFVVEKHAKHELAAQAQTRLGELQKLR